MSHVSNINRNELMELEDIKAACENNPLFEFVDSRVFRTYNGLGNCSFEIKVKGADYSIGVQQEKDGCRLQWDSYHRGGLPQKIGEQGGILTREIDIVKVRRIAMQKRMRITNVETDRIGWKIVRVEV